MTKKQVIAILAPNTWSASIIPVLMGTIYSLYRGASLQIDLFLAILLSAVGVQCFANITNDYFDFIEGVDTSETIYDREGSILVSDGVPLPEIKKLMLTTLILTSIPAAYLLLQRGAIVAVIGSVGFLVALLYSAGPLPISKTFLGEFFSGFTMGGLITWLAYRIQREVLDMDIVLISIPIMIYIGSILLTNGLCDIEKDRGTRVTLPILLGRGRSILLLKLSYVLMYLLVFSAALGGLLPTSIFLLLLSIPTIWRKLTVIRVENISLETRSSIMKNSVLSGIIFFTLYILILLGEILWRGWLI
ncbi:1,4-dihydroxy-2-naphthoate octaprenyltransferase [Propionigenium maris DSM 9537]|uniref:1,4-dihydroxy-2-naphthoate octaprenyltransferase n=1 Tax=Propionigenium maris DSM 9537 TaxID=1123000 RepID=A0A9W6LN69_9FUSO|nr:prenyltransferase [Propionigenium maris]GLI56283.1 1,4-dihydroxy-2-naphthoate octaprenyltransferase [Propionigenium maris DSM 9537]